MFSLRLVGGGGSVVAAVLRRHSSAVLSGAVAAVAAATAAPPPADCFFSSSSAAETASALAKADALFESNEYGTLATTLRASLAGKPDDAELLWRLGRACKKMADAEQPKSPAKQALICEGFGCAEKAVAANEGCGQAHKWYAILLSESGQFEGTSATIKNSFVVRKHFERAVELSPADATSRHLLGVWCFEVAKLSWIEQKAAAALFATPPSATYEEAIAHFEAAETMDPGFYPKNMLLLSMALSKIGRKAEAVAWRNECLAAKPCTPEDVETINEAQKLKL